MLASDELYLLAEQPLPDAAHYGDFAQIENGIGAVTYLRERVREGVAGLPRLDGRRIGIVTGTSMAPMMESLLTQLTGATDGPGYGARAPGACRAVGNALAPRA